MRTALTIAGSDSGGGAGIQADLKTFAAHGVFGTCVITAITAQNTLGVTAYEPVSSDLVTAQLEAVMSDLAAHAAKTGMLPTAATVEAVAAAVKNLDIPNLVVDPVMIAKSGDRLLDDDAVEAMRLELLPLARLVTPNVPEAQVLAGIEIRSNADCEEAARRIARLGPTAVLVKGGHRPGPVVRDLLFEEGRVSTFDVERVPGRHTHGTGCTFASAITAHLARGRSIGQAIPLAQRYVAGAIQHAPGLGRGHGPMQHVWQSPPVY